MNHFSQLAKIDVSKLVDKKQNLSYLSWPHAVNALMEHDPAANWVFHDPIMYGETMMVSCTVTAFGKPITMHLPVMDHRNQAVKNPDAVVVNKNMMRCLVKAIACHGLGLSVYAGEDLPSFPDPETGEVRPPPPPKPEPEPKPEAPPPNPVNPPTGKVPREVSGHGDDDKETRFRLKITVKREDDLPKWIGLVLDGFRLALGLTENLEDVMTVYRLNHPIHEILKREAPDDYQALINDFKARKEHFQGQAK